MYIIFWVQVINRFGDFVVPFLTLYLTEKLKLPIIVVGIVVTISSVIALPGSYVGGKLADNIGNIKTYLIFQSISAAVLIPCAFSNNKYFIIILLLLSTFFNSSVRPAINGTIIAILPLEKRKIGFSLQYIGINFGVAIGPIVGGFLFNNFLPLLFLGDAVTSIIAVMLVLLNLKKFVYSQKHVEYNVREKKESGNILQVLFRRPEVVYILLVYIIYSAIYTQYKFSLPLMLNYTFSLNGTKVYGFLMSINAITVIFSTTMITYITRKLHPIINLTIAGIFYAVGFGMVSIIKTFWLFSLSTMFWTIGEILMSINLNLYLANNSPANFKARFSSIGNVCMLLGTALGTTIAPRYINLFGIKSVWILILGISLIATVGMIVPIITRYLSSKVNVIDLNK